MSYPEYPRSNFPEEICKLPNMQDVSATLRPVVEQYNEAWLNNDVDKMAQLKSQYPNLEKSLFNADKFNVVLDETKATQKFFKERVDAMITEVAQHTIGIDDTALGDEKKTNAYSAEKTEFLTGVTIADNITISLADWDSSLEFTYHSSDILEDDRVLIYFADDSKLNASKAFIYVKSNTGEGNFVLKANKLPKSNLNIDYVEVVRK